MVALRILWRYILRDVLLYAALGLGVITLLLVLAQTFRLLESLLESGLGLSELGSLLGIVLPSYLAYAIPTALLFGVLLAFGRMSADGEIVALRASGVSVRRLLPPVVLLGAVAAGVTAWLVFDVEPRGRREIAVRLRELGGALDLIRPGRFRRIGARTFYVSEPGERDDCPLRGLLVGDLEDAARPLYITASCGRVVAPADTQSLGLELRDGTIQFFGSAQTERFRTIRFDRMSTQIDITPYIRKAPRARDHTFRELLELDAALARGDPTTLRGTEGRADVRTQIQRRLAFPLASVLLALLAVPLGIRPLRSGRSAGALTAVALMGIYWCLFSVAEMAASEGIAPPWLALWTPNALVLITAFWLIRRTVHSEA